MSPEKQSILDTVCQQINKEYGKNTVTKLTTEVKPTLDDVISSGSISLDSALGIGGYKKGRIIEIYGPESGGKTTACLHAMANNQKAGYPGLYIDAEHSLDDQYAQNLGIDLDKMYIAQPDYGEQGLNIALSFAKSGEVGLIVIDSVAALVPKSELEGNVGDSSIGTQARMMGQALRKLVGVCNKNGTTIIFVNQIRYKIGVFFGSPETTTGGNALKFYASQRLDIRRIADIKRNEEIIGSRTKVKVTKNKVAPPKKIAEFEIKYGIGIDSDGELIDLAAEDGVIKKSGAWYKYGEDSIAQGRQNAILWLNENPETKETIRQEILANRGLDSNEQGTE